MVPDIAKSGHSFKGAMAYYLHDKRQAGDTSHPQTAERVAWTDTRNLATDDPRAAMRIMVATAQSADELKKAAGVRNTGRKSNAHVYAYSLAWHPDEAGQLDRAEMLRAVDSSMKALGAEQHQAVIVCHRDQKHPHVHVIVNRVDPATGKMLSTSNDRLKLSDWANAYERERGQILTPKREEKRELREQFAERAERRQYAAEKRQQAEQRPAAAKSAGAMLKEFQEAQKAAHKEQWRDLSAKNKAARGQIYATYDQRIKQAMERHKAESKPIWAQHFREARAAERQFQAREKSLGGVIANAMAATLQQKVSGQLGNRGVLSATFSNALSSQARAAAFAQAQDMSRAELSRKLKTILDSELWPLKERRAAGLATQRQAFDAARAALIEQQNGERAKMREAWRQHYERRAQEGRKPRPLDRAQIEAEKRQQAAEQHRARMDVRLHVQRPDNQARERMQDRKARTVEKRQQARAAEDWGVIPMDMSKGQEKPAPQMEQKPMKRNFDHARTPSAGRAPVVSEYVTKPAPSPSPAGEAPKVQQRVLQDVPTAQKKPPERAAMPATKTDWQRATKSAPAQVQTPKDWGVKAERRPDTAAPAQAAKKDWSKEPPRKDWSAPVEKQAAPPAPRKDWSKSAEQRAQEKPAPRPTLARDRDRER